MSNAQDLLRTLDLTKVQALIRDPVWNLHEDEITEVSRRVLRAADLWLMDDLQADLGIVEWYWKNPGGGSGIMDLVKITGDKAELVDYKNTKNLSEPTFKNRLKYSLQTGQYLGEGLEAVGRVAGRPLTITKAVIQYRVFDDPTWERPVGNVVVVPVNYDERMVRRAEVTLDQARRNYLHISGVQTSHPNLGPWPQHMPDACLKYWEREPKCPFWYDCTEGKEPLIPPDKIVNLSRIPTSKSSVGLFRECPERYRREKIMEGTTAGTFQQNMGSAMHAGVAEVWAQAFEKYDKLLKPPSPDRHPNT